MTQQQESSDSKDSPFVTAEIARGPLGLKYSPGLESGVHNAYTETKRGLLTTTYTNQRLSSIQNSAKAQLKLVDSFPKMKVRENYSSTT